MQNVNIKNNVIEKFKNYIRIIFLLLSLIALLFIEYLSYSPTNFTGTIATRKGSFGSQGYLVLEVKKKEWYEIHFLHEIGNGNVNYPYGYELVFSSPITETSVRSKIGKNVIVTGRFDQNEPVDNDKIEVISVTEIN